MRYYYLILGVILFACHEQNKNKVSTAELMKSREIKKVSEAEILKKGGEIGNEILQSIQKMIPHFVKADAAICESHNWNALDSLKKAYKVKIDRVNGQSEGNSELELQLLIAYQYNLENNLKPTASVQKLDTKTVLFAYPIDIESNIYKYCLDSVSRRKAELWSVKIPIKEIIGRL
ncbi:hypothetical protein SAMN04488029_2274 [Reichenbachiella faecimaris]|uniref:Lipoprotein n=1 Tax=Reichenbachiella faecimaris TaxID=692418 RepID=A0A1W2GEQ2_REIFA|nr:hypothetical protein [Reichenbachiella faecimaris]SMD34972.1 hypothetical protein SAMN04488029_2274 [Reichenbachiella faecimaris]